MTLRARALDAEEPDRYEPEHGVALDATKVRHNDDGSITLAGRVARSGFQTYKFGRVFRPPEEVTSAKSLATIPGRAITVLHPTEGWVDNKNRRRVQVGVAVGVPRVLTLDDATDGRGETWVEVDMNIWDPNTIDEVLSGELGEISSGYDFRRGETAGLALDSTCKFVQRDIRHNHFALLPTGTARAGRLATLVLDKDDGNMTPDEIKALVAGEVAKARTADQAEIAKLQTRVNDMTKAQAKADADLAAAQDVQSTQDAIEQGVQEHLKLQREVSLFVRGDYPFGAKPASEVRRAVLTKMGRTIAADADEVYIQARWDSEVEIAQKRKSGPPRIGGNSKNRAEDSAAAKPAGYAGHLVALKAANKVGA